MQNEIFDYVKRWGIFAVLFVGLLLFVLSGYKEREKIFMDFISSQNITNLKIATTLERVDSKLCSIEEKLNKK